MEIFSIVLQVIAGLVIYNVWLVRHNRKTPYRAKGASNLRQEFIAYGLPVWSMYLVGIIKVAAATGLIVGVWLPGITTISAAILGVMRVGAVFMHILVRDTLKRTLPALGILAITLLILLL